ncbi:hypothetical protein V1477_012649 [Vespula maculifrons]|uniref:Uncharacterized protein n=1 Tax=Vespula maculifrons TaxID=7453 RepID=A0ABD2BTX5_VESMC
MRWIVHTVWKVRQQKMFPKRFYDRLPACVYMLPANSSSDCIAMAMAAAAVMAPAPAPTAAAAMAGHIEVHRT